jgi:hypothetical protein
MDGLEWIARSRAHYSRIARSRAHYSHCVRSDNRGAPNFLMIVMTLEGQAQSLRHARLRRSENSP